MVNLFASRLTTQLQRFFSWRPDPEAEALDAFSQDWTQLQGKTYSNPPPPPPPPPCGESPEQSLPAEDLASPGCPSMEEPTMVPDVVGVPGGTNPPPSEGRPDHPNTPRKCPGDVTRIRNFRKRAQNCSLRRGDRSLPGFMTPSSESAIIWCSGRSSDPVSGPISEVVNFLAHLV